jgi:hypothetical protein
LRVERPAAVRLRENAAVPVEEPSKLSMNLAGERIAAV